jgi:SNF2 family DNA or RNA helicase
MGRIEAEPVLDGGEYWYRVRFVKRVERVVEDDLEAPGDPSDTIDRLASQGRWGRLQAVRTALTVARIEHDNRSSVYTFKSQRILFEPHQYKPLLKILDSPDRRLLIADEVGLGKTIEAGLIARELLLRKKAQDIVVACPPSMLLQWHEELENRFGMVFQILDKEYIASNDETLLERHTELPQRAGREKHGRIP